MSELKLCPFCGEKLSGQKDMLLGGTVWTHKNNCVSLLTNPQNFAEFERCWNTRPIEDELRAEIIALNAKLEKVKEWK